VTRESCTKVADLGLRRYQKNQKAVWNQLIEAVAALKDAERHLLKAHIAMEGAKWHHHKVEDVRTWALWCQEAEEGSHSLLQLVGDLLGYSDPFSTEPSD
jgi:hypothetical protein